MNNSYDYCLTLHKSLNLFDTIFAIFPLTLLAPKLPIYTSNFSHKPATTTVLFCVMCHVSHLNLHRETAAVELSMKVRKKNK